MNYDIAKWISSEISSGTEWPTEAHGQQNRTS